MNTRALIISLTLFCTSIATAQTPEAEIRAAYCEIERKEFPTAQARLEKLLKADPANIFARRLMPAVLGEQVAKNDRSAINIARLNAAVGAFQQILPSLSRSQFIDADRYVIRLYDRIGGDEKSKELLKRVSDKSYSQLDRSRYYAELADQPRVCASDVAFTVREGKTPEKAALDKPKQCIASGLEFADQAIALDAENASAWLNKASLLNSAAAVAKLENDSRHTDLKTRSDEAVARWKAADAKNEKERLAREDASDEPPKSDFTPETISRELINYRVDTPIEKLVPELYVPSLLEDLVAPPPDEDFIPGDPTVPRSPIKPWKVFAPAGDGISVMLPGNVEATEEGSGKIYTARSGDIEYMIYSQPKPSGVPPEIMDSLVLNMLAWSFATTIGNHRMPDHTIDVKLLTKAPVAGRPARTYTVKFGSCKSTSEGAFITLTGIKNHYIITVKGATTSHPEVQRVLKSLKFNP